MNRFTSNFPRPLVSTEPAIKPQKEASPVAIPPVESIPKIPSKIAPPATVSPVSPQSSDSNSEPVDNLEQPEKPPLKEVISTSEQQLTTPQSPKSKDNSQSIEPSSSLNQEQPESGVDPSEQELNLSNLPESSETGQFQEAPAPSSEHVQEIEECEVQTQEESIRPEKSYQRHPRMRLPKFVDSY